MQEINSQDELNQLAEIPAREAVPTFNPQQYVIAIGASAGGLEAIHELFDNMPSNTHFTFVIVQHLSSDYKSLMPELLSRHTSMQVFVAENDMQLMPNCIYLIPNKYMMTVKGRKLKLHDKIQNHLPNNAVDIFFEALANEFKEKAVGIILSGTGTDGTKGVEFIKSNGGTVVVQEPISAKFDGMPNSAISTGHADIILEPEMMPEELIDFLQQTPLIKTYNEQTQKDDFVLSSVLEFIKDNSGQDFKQYKRPTIQRRVAKRMGELGIRSIKEYAQYLENNREEAKIISKEFLIRVTKFFRDPEAFEQVRLQVLPGIFHNKDADHATIKVWVVACSTGEEAYSLAILINEYLEYIKKPGISVKIFATDIDSEALEIASKGIYDQRITEDISQGLLNKYFIPEGNNYKVGGEIRKMVVFAHHNIISDPPFSRLDLISCRNMLIYMSQLLQKEVMRAFHFALNVDGFLFLGPSENVGALKDYVSEIDRKWKIYRCIVKPTQSDYTSFINPSSPSYARGLTPVKSKVKNGLNYISDIFKETLLEEHVYAGFFIDQECEVKQATGNFKRFINFPEGSFNFNLVKLVHSDLSSPLSISIRKAIKINEKVLIKNVKVHSEEGTRFINIIIKPYLNQKEYIQPFLFVVLEEEQQVRAIQSIAVRGAGTDVELIAEMEKELKETRENLQALLEEVESANEELQTSNEEIISSNEELQSTNEELQSLNEELHTVNVEHQLKIKELVELNDDLNNYFLNTDIGQIIIDKKLVIRKFSPAATKQINLIESDIGRSIIDISNNFKNLDFINNIKKVLSTGQPIEKEVEMGNDNMYLMKLNPYLRLDRSIDGVVISFVDITQLKKLNSILKAVFNSSPSGITAKLAVRDKENNIVDFEYTMANVMAGEVMRVSEEALIGKRMLELFPHMEKKFVDRYIKVVETGVPDKFEFKSPDNNKWYEIVGVKMRDGIVTTFTDITDKKNSADLLLKGYEDLKATTEKLQSANEQLETSNMDLFQFASIASHDLKEPLRKIQAFGNLLENKIRDKINDTEKSFLDKIIRSSGRMQNLIEDVLTFSRLSNTELPVSKTNLTEVVKAVVDDLEISIQSKLAEIKVSDLPEIHVVKPQMQQLFHNLISNALKFNESKPPVITIKTEEVPRKLEESLSIRREDFTVVSVEDNGIGFEKDFEEKIFKMFQRLRPTQYSGTGIGLAICKKIAENHGGFLCAESELNNGSKFLVILPKNYVSTQAVKNFHG